MEHVLDRLDMTDASACWIWPGAKNGKGYGQVYVRGSAAVKQAYRPAHRVVYELLVGEIPEGLTLDHLCRVRLCVNPAHLEPCSIGENARRGGNALKTACPQGHLYAIHGKVVSTTGERYCTICARERARRRHKDLRAA